MEENEFRIGNYYQLEKSVLGGGVCRIKNLVDFMTAVELLETNSIKPIPLTEEWLLKLGFKRFCKDFSKKGVIIHTRERGYVLRKSVPIIKTVHQLQNLYFTLTGEELIKNK